ncbi:chorismate synthase [Syntrophomonas erecta]
MLRFSTAGESHGKGLVAILEGLPAGLAISETDINEQLWRRQQGYGRGGRMAIESDRVEILAGVRNGITLGSPVSFIIYNEDYSNWQGIMGPGSCSRMEEKAVYRPRPGHADLAGGMKYHHHDMRNVLERASARETAARVAVGAFCEKLLKAFSIYIYSQVISIGDISAEAVPVTESTWEQFMTSIDQSPVRCGNPDKAKEMIEQIDAARRMGESLGGCFEVGAIGVPPGLGSHVSWEQRLDSRLAAVMMGVPAIKAVEIGPGVDNSSLPGSQVHDELFYDQEAGLYRRTNRAGGIEGGISNGETIFLRAYMKPIPTLYKPLTSVNTSRWIEEKAVVERSDICAVPAAAVVGEAMVAFAMARVFMDKFGKDHLDEIHEAYNSYMIYMEKVWKWKKILF